MKGRARMIIATILSMGALGTPVMADPIKTIDPETIVWQMDRPQNTKLALLDGDWTIPGAIFTYAFKMPDGAWFPPHRHPAKATITVIKGTLLLGEGADFDKSRASALHVGQGAVVPEGQIHFEGAKGETILIGTAIGPWGTDFLN